MAEKIRLAVFAKKRMTNPDEKGNTRPFYNYLTTLVNTKTGDTLGVQLKFREACGAPDPLRCPMFIMVDREDMNLSYDKYMTEDGDEAEAAKVWITDWEEAGKYIDHSLDDFVGAGV